MIFTVFLLFTSCTAIALSPYIILLYTDVGDVAEIGGVSDVGEVGDYLELD